MPPLSFAPDRAPPHNRANRERQASFRGVGTGGDGTRTHDLRIANATLSQLSYAPGFSPSYTCSSGRGQARDAASGGVQADRRAPNRCPTIPQPISD